MAAPLNTNKAKVLQTARAALVNSMVFSGGLQDELFQRGVITNQEIEKIIAMATNSEKATFVLGLIKSDSKYNGLCNALLASNQPEVVGILRPGAPAGASVGQTSGNSGNAVVTSEKIAEALSTCQLNLKDRLSIRFGLLDKLLANKVLKYQQLATIKAKPTHYEQVEELISILRETDVAKFLLFLNILREDGQLDAATQIETELYRE